MNSEFRNAPVVRGIPRFVPSEQYAGSFGLQWKRHVKAQLDSFTGKPISRDRLFSVTRWSERMEGQEILEAGSGAGRFTEVLLSTGASVWSFDLSDAVEANFENNGAHKNLYLFQASIYDVPLSEGIFDKVLCLGVLQHTPDPSAAFLALTKFIKPGGEIVIDVYKKTWTALLQWKYILRPFTKRIPSILLYRIITIVVTLLLPFAVVVRKLFGSIGARLFPIVEYSTLGLPYAMNKEWSILDTFDMYSPTYDTPQTLATVQSWFADAGLTEIDVRYGPNGIVGRGKKPL